MAVYTNINRNNKKQIKRPSRGFPARTKGYVLMGIASIGALALFTNFFSFLRYFIMGTFGVFSYAIISSLFIIAKALIAGKKYSFDKKYVIYLTVALLSFIAILQMAFLGAGTASSFSEYISDIYNLQTSVGGVAIGIITYPLLSVLNSVGAYIFFIIVLAIMSALIVDYLSATKTFKKLSSRTLPNLSLNNQNKKELGLKKSIKKQENKLKNKETVNITLNAEMQKEEEAKRLAREKLGLIDTRNNRFQNLSEDKNKKINYFGSTPFTPMFSNEKKKDGLKHDNSKRPPKIVHIDYNENTKKYDARKNNNINIEAQKRNLEFLRATIPAKAVTTNEIKGVGIKNPNEEFSTSKLHNKINERLNKKDHNEQKINIEDIDAKFEADLKDVGQISTQANIVSRQIDPVVPDETIITNKDIKPHNKNVKPESKSIKHGFKQMELAGTEIKKPDAKKVRYKKPSRYVRPPVNLLSTISTSQEDHAEEYLEKSNSLEKVLNDFKIPAKVIAVTKGPAVTRYELQMPAGVSVKKITQHAEDIAMTLASNGAVRIEAPIPGKNAVGVEVPNHTIATIGLKDVIDSREFVKSKSQLTFGLGKDISGKVQVCDLARMPHLLVAGATGSGKSVCLNSLILSLLYKTSPEDLRLILIDPKRVEFYVYNGLPHLMLPNVITESDKALNALNWAIDEMERRFQLFQNARVKNLAEYNELPEVASGNIPKVPMIVIIVDELADLMITSKREVEDKIMRLAAKARAAGIHLVLATQRPSVDVITGTIKANLPSRIAFSVTSIADSKTILDGGGAEKLLGKGDMLYAPIDYPDPRRIQGAFVSNEEVKTIVDFIKQNNEAYFDEKAAETINAKVKASNGNGSSDDNTKDFDVIMPKALKLIIESGQASISMIQRRFSVGYTRAARIIDQMELAKFISPSDGSKARNVYITLEEYNKLFPDE